MPLITQAFVLGAGLGTRLRPLTDDRPKPLVPIFQKPLITFAFDHLIDLGIERFFVNTHHRPKRFAEIFGRAQPPGAPQKIVGQPGGLSLPGEGFYRDRKIEFRHEPNLLETAGGLANIADSLGDEPLLVYNGDVLTDLPIARLIDNHFRAGNIVTLALRSGGGPNHIAFDSGTGRVIDIRNQLGTGAPEEFVFSGIYIVERKFVDLLQRGVKRSVIPVFLELIRRGEKLGGVVIDQGHWWDVGNREAYLQLHRDLPSLDFPSYPVDDPDWRISVHQTAIVDPTVQLRGCSVVGADCRVGEGAILEDTILWPGVQIASRSDLRGCIVRSRCKASGVHRNIDI
jgi:mannose-1-phosphate guanylyltransferase